ncbi:MAG: hypothetical protein D6705_07520 [Deltaproteobacteria bacterium]|nr:MAG: hypothetical protein D6705_07520 [Deltaproteobacteria bacterium]
MRRTSNRTILAALIVAGAVVASCKDDGESRADRMREASESAVRLQCECWAVDGSFDVLGYSSVEECVADLTDPSGYDEACVDDVWNDSAYDAWADCYVPEFEKYIECERARGCSSGEFSCADGSDTIPENWVCDGTEDCGDGSDEQNCDGVEACTDPTATCGDPPAGFESAINMCQKMFACADGNGTIPENWVCDGEADCGDGSDEQGC